MTAISLDYAAPEEDLRDYLSLFYEFRADVPLFDDTQRADLAQFRIILAGTDGEYRFADGHVARAPAIQIMGPTTGPVTSRITGPVHMFGVGLLPAGWGSLLDFEASLLVNRVVDAVALLGSNLKVAAQQIAAANTLAEKVVIGSALARAVIKSGSVTVIGFTRIVDEWLHASPSPDVDTLVRATGMSRRQVERNCNRYYGSPPKLLARKYRALKAAIQLARHEAGTHELVDNGFYDQSHFIREIKHFTGVTPKTITDDLPTLAKLTLKRSDFGELAPLVRET